jgi:hypothetical protein
LHAEQTIAGQPEDGFDATQLFGEELGRRANDIVEIADLLRTDSMQHRDRDSLGFVAVLARLQALNGRARRSDRDLGAETSRGRSAQSLVHSGDDPPEVTDDKHLQHAVVNKLAARIRDCAGIGGFAFQLKLEDTGALTSEALVELVAHSNYLRCPR